jgi:SAM-dependent methyltransferase
MEPFRRLNRILEVGAGRGWFSSVAAQSGWETWAVEINRDAVEHLGRQGIHRVLVDTAEDFDAPVGSMDVVRMWDVIEHLQSPRQAVTSIHRVLRPGGLLRLATTNFASLSRWVNGPEWVYLNGADHIYLFEPHTISRLLTECGFSQIRIRTRSFNLRRKVYHPERDLPARFASLRPFRKLIDALIGVTMYGHQMIVTAIKPV